MRVTVARIGPPADRFGSILAPGAIPACEVPVYVDFDFLPTPIGRAVVRPDGSADLEFLPGISVEVVGIEAAATIGMGFHVLESHTEGDVRVIDRIELMAVGVSRDLIKRFAAEGISDLGKRWNDVEKRWNDGE